MYEPEKWGFNRLLQHEAYSRVKTPISFHSTCASLRFRKNWKKIYFGTMHGQLGELYSEQNNAEKTYVSTPTYKPQPSCLNSKWNICVNVARTPQGLSRLCLRSWQEWLLCALCGNFLISLHNICIDNAVPTLKCTLSFRES